jgi:hypothetical protein
MHPLQRLLLSAAVLALAAVAARAQVTAECPLIRPPGLGAGQVDALVAQKVAAQLQQAPDTIDPAHTFHKQDGTDNAASDFLLAAVAIGEALGFDALAAYRAAAKARGSEQMSEVLTIADMQALARTAYAAGHDGPPPEVPAGVAYRLRAGLTVHAPAPADGWQVVNCGSDHVAFRRSEGGRPPLETAMTRVVSVPAWESDQAFEKTVRQTLEASMTGIEPQSTALARAAGTSTPCIDLRVAAVASGQPLGLRGRVCYTSRESTLAYITLFSRLGDGGLATTARIAEADAYVAGASPK